MYNIIIILLKVFFRRHSVDKLVETFWTNKLGWLDSCALTCFLGLNCSCCHPDQRLCLKPQVSSSLARSPDEGHVGPAGLQSYWPRVRLIYDLWEINCWPNLLQFCSWSLTNQWGSEARRSFFEDWWFFRSGRRFLWTTSVVRFHSSSCLPASGSDSREKSRGSQEKKKTSSVQYFVYSHLKYLFLRWAHITWPQFKGF